jgi:hypothetical protein
MHVNHPSYDDFVRHATKLGTECVYETAVVYLTEPELLDLDLELARIDGPRRRRFRFDPKVQVLALAARGMVPAAIADAVGLSDRRVKTILSECRTSKNGVATPHHQRADRAVLADRDGLVACDDRRGRRALSASQTHAAIEPAEAPAA